MSPVLAFTTTPPANQRLPTGGLIDRATPLLFTFDGTRYTGLAGDTLASALVANGVRLLGRSFKYHRPRGLLAAGPEEPNALVELRTGARREPNLPATSVELFEGLKATSQNRFPTLRFDLGALNGLAAPLLSAGFYYKTFMWPAAFWERLYEPLIRRAAGLGRAPTTPDPDRYERGHLHCDVLVIGAGPAGLAAALAAARTGARTVLADDDTRPGGRLLSERDEIDNQPGPDWAAQTEAELRTLPNLRLLTRTTVFAAYDHGTYAAVERTADHLPTPGPHPRQTYWRVITNRCVLATGALERPLVFPGNDRPGTMLAGAARTFINRYAARPGRRAVILAAGPDGLRTAADLRNAGIEVAAIVTPDPATPPSGDTQIMSGGHVTATSGRQSLTSVTIQDAIGTTHTIQADLLLMAGGWSPNLALTCHTGGRPRWDDTQHAFVPGTLPPGMTVAGSAAGHCSLDEALAAGTRAGEQAAADTGHAPTRTPPPTAQSNAEKPAPLWLMPTAKGKAFVDFQHDVTASDIALAHREGFRSIEHLKRYTTLGMATDQGKTSNLNGLALMAELTGAGIAGTGTTTFRPPYSPVTIGALAGHSVGRDFRPTRITPAHDWAIANGAAMVEAGAWLRAGWFPRPEEDWQVATDREVLATRSAAGLCDVSTLGKIELVGAGAGHFLDRLYANTMSTLKPGRVRYGLMLREDGFVMDDGTVARLSEHRWAITTTTAQAAPVLAHMEYCHQLLWPGLDVHFATTTDQWAQFCLAGPKARQILAEVVETDVSDQALPHMSCTVTKLARTAGVPAGTNVRIFRISFSGERAYEIAVPARQGLALATALMAAGKPHALTPYGLEALGVMRIEKGHPAGAELNGQTTARDLGMAKLMSTKKDYIGRALAARPRLLDPDRPTLVGLRPTDPAAPIRAGAHLLPIGAPNHTDHDQGWISSAARSPTSGYIALAFLQNGPARHGERLRAYDPVRDGNTEVQVVPPCHLDPEGTRLRG